MIYSKEMVVPQNTLFTNPFTDEIEIVEGVIKRVWVRWRWGSAGLCGCAIFRGGSQCWPTTLGEWFPSTTLDTEFIESYIVDDEPLRLLIRAYNHDILYPHKLWVGVSVLRPRYPSGVIAFADFLAGWGES